MPDMNILYTNTDQVKTIKKLDLLELVEWKKPHIIATCEIKPKKARERTNSWLLFSYSNLDSNIGRVIVIYIPYSLIDRKLRNSNQS